jgi:hypothetical protein
MPKKTVTVKNIMVGSCQGQAVKRKFGKEAHMAVMNVFKTTTTVDSPLDASGGTKEKPLVSDFLTVQSFANFAAMTGAITAAWHALQNLTPQASTLWVPYVCAFIWAAISILVSLEGLKKSGKMEGGTLLETIFIAVINSLILASAVVGTNIVTS